MNKIKLWLRYIGYLFKVYLTKGYYVTNPPEDAADLTYEPDTVSVVHTPKEKVGVISKKKKDWNLFVFLDAGHGPSTKGKRSPKFKDGSRFYEWKFNIEIVRRVSYILKTLGIKHVIVNDYLDQDHGNDLEERANFINNYMFDTNLFPLVLSHHANAWGTDWNSVRGSEVWIYYNGNNSSKQHTDRMKFADIFISNIVTNLNTKNRGVKYRLYKQFYLLRKIKYFTLFLEFEFFTNILGVKLLKSEEGKELIVKSVVDSIIQLNEIIRNNNTNIN